jgi:nucleoside-triphosphatase
VKMTRNHRETGTAKGEETPKSEEIWLVTGWRDAGKTTFCQKMAQAAKTAGWDAAGILTLGVEEGGQKTGFTAMDVRTGEERSLASMRPGKEDELILGPWHFDRETLAWGNQIFREALTCDLLVIDELGPLEFTLNSGWKDALSALKSVKFRIALVVVRPELVGEFEKIFNVAKKIEISSQRDRVEQVEELKRVFKG